MSKSLILALVLLGSRPSYGFLDFISGKADEAGKVIAYSDAVGDLIGEIAPETATEDGLRSVEGEARSIRKELNDHLYVGRDTKALLEGPHWSGKRLDRNIRRTTGYIKRAKRLVARAAALGTVGAVAVNTAEMGMGLNEVQKNQQAQILMEREQSLLMERRRLKERKSWGNFIARERAKRKPLKSVN